MKKMMKRMRKVIDNAAFYKVVGNWHKHPLASKVLCWFGRHDYEYQRMDGPGSAILYCFYCMQRKRSSCDNTKTWDKNE